MSRETRDDRRQAAADRKQTAAEAAADRKQAEADRRQAEADRKQAAAEAAADRKQAAAAAEADRRQLEAERRRSDERFTALLREFREDSARREATTQRAFRDIRTVGLSIVKTLNRHTRLLENIDRKLGGRNNGRPDNGRAA